MFRGIVGLSLHWANQQFTNWDLSIVLTVKTNLGNLVVPELLQNQFFNFIIYIE